MIERRRERENRVGGMAIDAARLRIAMVMGQIRAYDDERFRPAPETLHHVGDLVRVGGADGERYDAEFIDHRLQERQLHFERMLLRMRGVALLNPVSYTHLRAHETDSYLVCRL